MIFSLPMHPIVRTVARRPGHNTSAILVGADEALARRTREKGIWRAFQGVLSSDANVFDPTETSRSSWLEGLDHTRDSQPFWEPSRAESAKDGEIGYTAGCWTICKGAQYTSGTYLSIWQHRGKEWRLILFGRDGTDFPDVPSGHVFYPTRPIASFAKGRESGFGAELKVLDSGELASDRYFPDTLLLRPDQPPKLANGPTDSFAAGLPGTSHEIMAKSEDFAVTYGKCLFGRTPGNYIRVWRRTPEGWRVTAEFGGHAQPSD